MMKKYKVTIYINTPYSTIVEAENEEEAKDIALDREAPSEYSFLDNQMEDEWVSDGLLEFPNIGNQEPEIEDYDF